MSDELAKSAPLEVAKLAKELNIYLEKCIENKGLSMGVRKIYVGVRNMLNIYLNIFEKIRETLSDVGQEITIDKRVKDNENSLSEKCEMDNVLEYLRGILSIAKKVSESDILNRIALLSVYYSQFIDVLNSMIDTIKNKEIELSENSELYQCDVCGFISVGERPVRCPICNESGKNFKIL